MPRKPSTSRPRRSKGISFDDLSTTRALRRKLDRIVKRLEVDKSYVLGKKNSATNEFLTKLPSDIHEYTIPQLKALLGDLSVDRKGPNLEILEEGPLDFYGTIEPGDAFFMRKLRNGNFSMVTGKAGSYGGGGPYIYSKFVGDGKMPPKTLSFTPQNYEWIHHSQLDSKKHDNTNVFGASGKLILKTKKKSIRIPEYEVNKRNRRYLEFFGVRGYRFGDIMPPAPIKMHLVSYRISKGFVKRWAEKHNGMFLERHPFPHVITTTEKGKGTLVVGKFVNGTLHLIGIKVKPLSHLYIDANVVHQDWHFIGKMITSITNEVDADTVFLVNADNDQIKLAFV